MGFGQFLHELIAERLAQDGKPGKPAEFARRVGKKRQIIHDWCIERHGIDPEDVDLMARVLGLSGPDLDRFRLLAGTTHIPAPWRPQFIAMIERHLAIDADQTDLIRRVAALESRFDHRPARSAPAAPPTDAPAPPAAARSRRTKP